MPYHRIRYCLHTALGISRFDFYCSAENQTEALQKMGDWMRDRPGNYRSFSAGFAVAEHDLPQCFFDRSGRADVLRRLEAGAALRVG